MRELLEQTIRVIEQDRGIGLEPLINEFVYDFPSLSDEAKQKRVESITSYYRQILDKSNSVKLAYNKTKEWANRIYIQARISDISNKWQSNKGE